MTNRAMAPVVIIGTGLSGYSLAREFRKLDKTTPLMLITADDGHNYSKPMLSTGFTKEKTADALSMADAGTMAEQLNAVVRTFTTVTGIDTQRRHVRIGDETQPYAKLVLAWGADVIHLELDGNGVDRVFSINDLMDYRQFRQALEGSKRVVVMGAGLIGCEFANDLINGGYAVDVVAPSDTVLPGLLPVAAGNAVRDALAAAGVRFHLNNSVRRLDRVASGVSLTLADGKTLDADLVISAVGLRPRVALAKAAGLAVARGIVVNRRLETSAPEVFAFGDCAEVDGHLLLYVLPLMACAKTLARTLTGEPAEVSYGTMPVVVKTPACPVVVCPPSFDQAGQWHSDGTAPDLRLEFRNPQGQILGWALTGARVAEKQTLTRETPPLHRG